MRNKHQYSVFLEPTSVIVYVSTEWMSGVMRNSVHGDRVTSRRIE